MHLGIGGHTTSVIARRGDGGFNEIEKGEKDEIVISCFWCLYVCELFFLWPIILTLDHQVYYGVPSNEGYIPHHLKLEFLCLHEHIFW